MWSAARKAKAWIVMVGWHGRGDETAAITNEQVGYLMASVVTIHH
jgi:hypothetical protein